MKPKKKIFSVRLTDADIKFLNSVAETEQVTVGDVIRALVAAYKTKTTNKKEKEVKK